MANNIVQINVTQTIAPAPDTLQRTGVFVSQGGSTLAIGATALVVSQADLLAITRSPLANATLVWSAGVVTVTTAAPHGMTIADGLNISIAGAVPTAYNGIGLNATVTGASTFTYPLVSNPGLNTVPGTWAPLGISALIAMGATFFAQGTATSVYVIEVGNRQTFTALTTLSDFITANSPQVFYTYLIPRFWAYDSSFISLMGTFNATTAKTYFFVTVDTFNHTSFIATMKCVVTMLEAPVIPITEYSAAAALYVWLNNRPSTTNKVAPMAKRIVTGVTAYPLRGNASLLATLAAANINWIGTGAEGGISNTLLNTLKTKDGRDATYWYSVDWTQINLDLDLSNEVINGANNPVAPLYFNQDGINRLQARAQATMNRGISYGMVLSPVTVAAVDFPRYVIDNPNDYPIGRYAGLSVSYTPARGFEEIVFNVNVTDFPTV